MIHAYAFKTLKPCLNSSTSGGAFSQIIELFFDNLKGIVYGATLDENLDVVHKRATNKKDCEIFRKSKYVRSKTIGINDQIITDLNNDNNVLFIGTPCQVYNLIKYLESKQVNTKKLFTIDLICNGAPSHNFWDEYKSWLENKYNRKLVYFGFREKGDKLNPYLTKAIFSDGFKLTDSSSTACYNRLFLKKLIIPKGCFACRFKCERRISDITLGDFWGADEIFKNKDLRRDLSLVLVNTKKGESLFNAKLIDLNSSILIECKNKEYLKYQNNLLHPTKIPKEYNAFWNDYRRNGISYVLNKYADACFPHSVKYFLRKVLRTFKSIMR